MAGYVTGLRLKREIFKGTATYLRIDEGLWVQGSVIGCLPSKCKVLGRRKKKDGDEEEGEEEAEVRKEKQL